jgi:hypothetical protein
MYGERGRFPTGKTRRAAQESVGASKRLRPEAEAKRGLSSHPISPPVELLAMWRCLRGGGKKVADPPRAALWT